MLSMSDLGEYTFTAKYAKYLPEFKRRESWEECVTRYEDFLLDQYADKNIEQYIRGACNLVRQKRCLGSQRLLQFAGSAVSNHNARAYNCAGGYCDNLNFFKRTMYLLLCGCGVGFSVQKHHINRLPEFQDRSSYEELVYTIEDSIEGWADSIDVLIRSYLDSDYKYKVVFKYDKIRPEGSEFSHGIGQAPGPDPLENAHKKIQGLLEACLEQGQTRLKPINAYDIVMHSADAVLAGGIRRSATICIFSLDDEEMLTCKTGNWLQENPQRGRSNNSVMLIRGETSWEDFYRIFKFIQQWGEPGFYWASNREQLPNPCVEIGFYCYNEAGESGFQMCNLSTINGALADTFDRLKEAIWGAAVLGTLQAGLDEFPYLGEVSEEIIRREALLGVSMTGMMENPELILDPDVQKELAQYVIEVNKEVADLIGINPAARATCIKPEGSTSARLGTSSGKHFFHARRFLRKVQANKLEAPAQYFYKLNPFAVEESVWSANNTDVVLTFPCEVSEEASVKSDWNAIKFLESVKKTQMNWVEYGKVKSRCAQEWISHNVSNTVTVKPEEWEDVAKYIFTNQEYFTGVSFIPDGGDKDYPQAPFCEVFTPQEIIENYGDASLLAGGLIDDCLEAFDGNLWQACDCVIDKHLIPDKNGSYYNETKNIKQKQCVERVRKFARKYYSSDYKKVTYLMKDLHNWKLWLDLRKFGKSPDYSDMIEERNTTKGTNEVACAGGACQI